MSTVLLIARRYLFARKSHQLVNLVSWVSVAGVAVGTFGLIVVLSVFNGFGSLVLSLYDTFDPDIRIKRPVEDPLLLIPRNVGFCSMIQTWLEWRRVWINWPCCVTVISKWW